MTSNTPYHRKGNVFSFEDEVIGAELLIFSLDGRVVGQVDTIEKELKVEHLNQGYYFVQILNGNEQFLIKEYFSN